MRLLAIVSLTIIIALVIVSQSEAQTPIETAEPTAIPIGGIPVATSTPLGVVIETPTATPEPATCATAAPNVQAGLVQDCETLLGLKDELEGSAELNWSVQIPMTEWEGLTLGTYRVIELNLPEKGLDGVMPSGLGQLTGLRGLNLAGNNLGAPIPAEIGNLSNLRVLFLSRNNFNDSLPPELGNLSNLVNIYFHTSGLIGPIPAELGNLSNLTHISLADNNLSGEIPSELGKLSKLEGLKLRWNQLSGEIPSELGNMSSLVTMSLDRNFLSGEIPEELGNISGLHFLMLRENGFSGCIPTVLESIPLNDFDQLGLIYCKEQPVKAEHIEALKTRITQLEERVATLEEALRNN